MKAQHPKVSVIRLPPGALQGAEALARARALLSILRGEHDVGICLHRVETIDEAGVTLLVRLHSHLAAGGRRLKLVGASTSARASLDALGLSSLLGLTVPGPKCDPVRVVPTDLT